MLKVRMIAYGRILIREWDASTAKLADTMTAFENIGVSVEILSYTPKKEA